MTVLEPVALCDDLLRSDAILSQTYAENVEIKDCMEFSLEEITKLSVGEIPLEFFILLLNLVAKVCECACVGGNVSFSYQRSKD